MDSPIDPIAELKHSNNIIPLLTVLNSIGLDRLVDGVPLLSLLCQKYIPFEEYVSADRIVFALDEEGRSALQYAVEADDVRAAAWCCRNNIKNTSDDSGSSAILDAVRLGRRRMFMLLVHYRYYDD